MHASCCHDDFLYVFCGQDPSTKAILNSIERFDTQESESEWELIEIEETDLTPRFAIGVVPINETEILILGGKGVNNIEYHSFIVVNTEDFSCQPVTDPKPFTALKSSKSH